MSVRSGKVIAGPGIRMACERHLHDLEKYREGKLDYIYNPEKGKRVENFFRDVLTIEANTPFKLFPWQQFYIYSLFGWLEKATGHRRFRTAYIESAKGSGKSPLNAGVCLYMLFADGESKPQVFVCAHTADQAKVPFGFATDMVERSKTLQRESEIHGGKTPVTIYYNRRAGVMKRVATAKGGAGFSGWMPSCIYCDELMEWMDDSMMAILQRGTKARKQPLTLISTNSGESQQNAAWEFHEHSLAVAKGEKKDDYHFGLVFDADEKDDPFEDESCWIKTNPSLPTTPGIKYLREQVNVSSNMPSKKNQIMQLNFCKWVESSSAWIESTILDECESDKFLMKDLKGMRQIVGIDLSTKRDLTAVVSTWQNADGIMHARAKFFLPEYGLSQRARDMSVPFTTWQEQGILVATPGKVVDYLYVADYLAELHAMGSGITAVAFDPYKIESLLADLKHQQFQCYLPDEEGLMHNAGVPLYRHPQNLYKKQENWRHRTTQDKVVSLNNGLQETLHMPASIDALENAMLKNEIWIEKNACLRWNILSASTYKDPSANRRFEKHKSKGLIDGCVALAMSVGLQKALPMQNQEPTILVF